MKKQQFNFKAYEKYLPEHKKKLYSNFLTWFIGFSEGDGSFISSVTKADGKTRNFFYIVQKDPKILHYIKRNLGFGLVKQRSDDGHFFYYVSDQKNIDRLIRIFNGNIVVEKVSKRFEKWFIEYERGYTKVKDKVSFLPFDPDRSKSLLNLENPWLCGFTDAEGCFSGRIESIRHVKLKFSIKQRYSSSIIKNLRSLFGYVSPVEKEYEVFETCNKDNLIKISNYFCVHQLKSNKKISYNRWRRVLLLRDQEDRSDKSIKKFKRLLENINKK